MDVDNFYPNKEQKERIDAIEKLESERYQIELKISAKLQNLPRYGTDCLDHFGVGWDEYHTSVHDGFDVDVYCIICGGIIEK